MSAARMIACGVLLAVGATPVLAQDVERFRLERSQDGYVRTDTRTGATSLCRESGGELVCRVAVEERDAYEAGIAGLQDRIEALEDRVAALEGNAPPARLSDDQEFEQTLGYMERFFRRFMGIVKDLEQEFRSEEPQADRT